MARIEDREIIMLPGVDYTDEQAQIMIEKKRSIAPQDIDPRFVVEYREKGMKYYTLRDLVCWKNPLFRHMILGFLAAQKDYEEPGL